MEKKHPNKSITDPRSRITQHQISKEPLNFGFEDIDNALMYYFKNDIKLNIFHNGRVLEVPVIYGSPERWKSAQKDGFYREEGNKIMAPFLMFKRDSISPNKSLTNKLDANRPSNYGIVKKQYDSKNKYDNFSVLTNRKPKINYEVVVVPDFVNITYNCLTFTYYTDQLNKIIEAINYASDSYWGNERHKFKVRATNFSTPTELIEGRDRNVRCSFNLEVFAHIIPQTLQKDINSIKKFSGKTKVRIGTEITLQL